MNLTRSMLLIVVIAVGFSLFFACTRDSSRNPTQTSDSTTLLTIKWKLIKDSVSNIGTYYFMEGGTPYYPTAGVYFGTATDYWDFHSNGSVYIHENNQSYTSTYQLHSNNKLVITDMLVHDTGRVVTLTSSDAIFDWSRTSPNNGKYYRRVYLKK